MYPSIEKDDGGLRVSHHTNASEPQRFSQKRFVFAVLGHVLYKVSRLHKTFLPETSPILDLQHPVDSLSHVQMSGTEKKRTQVL